MEWREKAHLEREGELSSKKKWGENTPASLSDLILAVPNSWSSKFTLPPCSLHHYSICPQIPPRHLQRWSGGSGSRGNASCKASRRVQRRVGVWAAQTGAPQAHPRSWGTSPRAPICPLTLPPGSATAKLSIIFPHLPGNLQKGLQHVPLLSPPSPPLLASRLLKPDFEVIPFGGQLF